MDPGSIPGFTGFIQLSEKQNLIVVKFSNCHNNMKHEYINLKSIFLTSKITFANELTGGVQLCSQEYFYILNKAGFQIEVYYVPYSYRFIDRLLIRYRLGIYNSFNVSKEIKALIDKIEKNSIKFIFLNMASIVRFAKPLKEHFGKSVKIILLSHGNESGDLLHLTTNPLGRKFSLRTVINIIRLGFMIHIESNFRKKYLDVVLTVSEIECQIENWLGAKKVIFVPRIIVPKKINLNPVFHRIGFAGRLDHPPNYQGLTLLCDEFLKLPLVNFRMRLVGAPIEWGNQLSGKYSFIDYLGELSDDRLIEEVSTWTLFINPVFWYSTGVSTKLGWAINHGLPIITTQPGMRGYIWSNGTPLIANDPASMAEKIYNYSLNQNNYYSLVKETEKIQVSNISLDEIIQKVQALIKLE